MNNKINQKTNMKNIINKAEDNLCTPIMQTQTTGKPSQYEKQRLVPTITTKTCTVYKKHDREQYL